MSTRPANLHNDRAAYATRVRLYRMLKREGKPTATIAAMLGVSVSTAYDYRRALLPEDKAGLTGATHGLTRGQVAYGLRLPACAI